MGKLVEAILYERKGGEASRSYIMIWLEWVGKQVEAILYDEKGWGS